MSIVDDPVDLLYQPNRRAKDTVFMEVRGGHLIRSEIRSLIATELRNLVSIQFKEDVLQSVEETPEDAVEMGLMPLVLAINRCSFTSSR